MRERQKRSKALDLKQGIIQFILDYKCNIKSGSFELLVSWDKWDGETWISVDDLHDDIAVHDFIDPVTRKKCMAAYKKYRMDHPLPSSRRESPTPLPPEPFTSSSSSSSHDSTEPPSSMDADNHEAPHKHGQSSSIFEAWSSDDHDSAQNPRQDDVFEPWSSSPTAASSTSTPSIQPHSCTSSGSLSQLIE